MSQIAGQTRNAHLLRVAPSAEWPVVRGLFREYAQQLGVDLCFQGFEAELAGLPGDYAAPFGGVWLAWFGAELAGCVAMRPLKTVDHVDACEMKRLYVRPAYRGMGVGRILSEQVLQSAREADYQCVLLDTLDSMEAARALYADLGFVEVAPYYHNPIAGAHYLKATLR